jgi:hypothetical protein
MVEKIFGFSDLMARTGARREPEPSARVPPVSGPRVEAPPVPTIPVEPPAEPTLGAGPLAEVPPVLPPEVKTKRGFLQLPNTIIFSVYPLLRPDERVVYEELFLFTHGFGQNPGIVSRQKVCARIGFDDKRLRRTIGKLEAKGLVRRLGFETGGAKEGRGTLFDVVVPGTPGAGTPGTRTPGPRPRGSEPSMKENMKENMKADVYEIRKIAARLFEIYRDRAGYTHADLERDVRAALDSQGIAYDDVLVAQATRGMID